MDIADPPIDLAHLGCPLDLRDHDQVGLRQHDGVEVFEAQRQRVDPHHPLGLTEVEVDQRTPYEIARRVLVIGVHRVFEVEDHAIGAVLAGVDHVPRLVARQVEPRATEPVASRGAARLQTV